VGNRDEPDDKNADGKADVVKSLSANIPYSSPDHPLPCRSIPTARQATVT